MLHTDTTPRLLPTTRRTGLAATTANHLTSYRTFMQMLRHTDRYNLAVLWSVFVLAVAGVAILLFGFVGPLAAAAAGAALLLPGTVEKRAARLTIPVPDEFTYAVKAADLAIDRLAAHDPATADQLYATLVFYVQAAPVALDVAGQEYHDLAGPGPAQARLGGRRYGDWSWEPPAAMIEAAKVEAEQRRQQRETNPVGQVLAAIGQIATTAREAATVAQRISDFAEKPLRELEADRAAERNNEQRRNLAAALDSARLLLDDVRAGTIADRAALDRLTA